MKRITQLIISLTLFASTFAAGSDITEYEVVDGHIVVFGHTLVPREPLPDFRGCEECESAHSVEILQSPDMRHVLIISDVHLANFDWWVFDTQSQVSPVRIADTRRGRHHLRSEWHGNERIELFFGGMGYTVSLFVDVSNPEGATEVGDPLLYNADRDIYVRYVYNGDTGTNHVEIGAVFSGDGAIERFPITLDNEYLSDARFMIESAKIDGAELTVTYRTTSRGQVRDVFTPRILTIKE